jgi:Na+-transporting NADH:ubiquinone oxidoreductase subunit NqrE
LSTFWLKIEQFWPFEEISIFSNGGHLGYRTALTDMATITKNRNFFQWPKLLYFKPESAQI